MSIRENGPDTVVYHANCHDGFTAAWVVRRAFPGKDIRFIPASYGPISDEIVNACSYQDVMVLDFSFSEKDMRGLAHVAESVVVLDHHKTAQAALESLDGHDGLEIHFDMDRSGAQMTWDYLHPGENRPLIVDYVADRDLWKWQLPASREISAFLQIQEFDFDTWDAIEARLQTKEGRIEIPSIGIALLQATKHDVERIIKSTHRTMRIAGYVVDVINAPYHLMSEAVGTLASQSSQGFAAGYVDTPSGRGFSLRRRFDCQVDMSEIAKVFGGGGHAAAAGFHVPRSWEGVDHGGRL